MSNRSLKPWAIALAIALLPIVVVGTRAIRTARTELEAGRLDEEQGNFVRATEHYRRAMRWTFPFNPYPEQGALALHELAGRLEIEGDVRGALLAWRSIAGSAAATSSFWKTESSIRTEAVDAIVRLSKSPDVERPSTVRATSPDAFASSGSAWWGTILLLGFAGWVAGLGWTASRGFDATGRFHWTMARRSVVTALAGLVLFILGMLFA